MQKQLDKKEFCHKQSGFIDKTYRCCKMLKLWLADKVWTLWLMRQN